MYKKSQIPAYVNHLMYERKQNIAKQSEESDTKDVV